jgi:glucosamine 6-phosphate synthetase-like amidotransferase/phosphosugar isomerase protein
MCGLFGFITREGHDPDIARLKRIAIATERRGRHAFGLAWVTADGKLHTFKRPGPATANLGDLDQCAGALVVVGHCRYATHGTWEDNRNNHPHRAGGGWIAHNGVVHNHAGLVRQYGLAPRTACDSEVLGLLLAKICGSLERRAACTARHADGPLAILGAWAKPARLLIVRNGNPLWFGETPRSFYFGSLADELPGAARPICDRYAGLLTFDGEALTHRAVAIRS